MYADVCFQLLQHIYGESRFRRRASCGSGHLPCRRADPSQFLNWIKRISATVAAQRRHHLAYRDSGTLIHIIPTLVGVDLNARCCRG